MSDQDTIKKIQQLAIRNAEVRKAIKEYPLMEIGAAYKLWKTARGEQADLLFSNQLSALNKDGQRVIKKLHERPCTRKECEGVQVLEAVCTGCIEGQAGYKSKWTCRLCLHRDLLKQEYLECLKELSLLQKA